MLNNCHHLVPVALSRSSSPPLLHRNLSQELRDESSAASMNSLDSAVAVAAKSLAPLQLGILETSSSPPKHKRGDQRSTRDAKETTSQPPLKRMASGVVLGPAGQGEQAAAQGLDAPAAGKPQFNRSTAAPAAAARAGPTAAPPSVKPHIEPHHR